MLGRFLNRIRETRNGYWQPQIEHWQDFAAGKISRADPSRLAVVSACASTWAQALSAVRVEGPPAIDKAFLSMVGTDLIRRGRSTWRVSVMDGMPTLMRPALAQRTGNGWILTWNRDPADTFTEQVLDAAVLNLTWERDPRYEWEGVPPWAGLAGNLAAEADTAHALLFSGPSGHVLNLSASQFSNSTDAKDSLTETEKALGGKSRVSLSGGNRGQMVVISTAVGQAIRGNNSGSIQPAKIHHGLTSGDAQGRAELEREIAAACMVPAGLLNGTGSTLREGQRVFQNRVQHRCDMIAETIAAKLGMTVSMDASRVFPTDVSQQARALKAMVDAGVPVEQAQALAGLKMEN